VWWALRGIEDLIIYEYASVELRSRYIVELVHEAVQEAEDAVKRATGIGAKALQAAEQGIEESMSAFIAWAARHGVDVDDALSSQETQLKMGVGEPG